MSIFSKSNLDRQKTVSLDYGNESVELNIPSKNIARIVSVQDIPILEGNNFSAIKSSLDEPIDSKRIEELCFRKKVLVFIEDDTRDEPHKEIIENIVPRLKDADFINFIITTGTHEPDTEGNREILNLIVQTCQNNEIDNFRTNINRTGKDSRENEFVYVDSTSRKTPVYTLKEVLRADLHIIASDMKVHYFAGYSNFVKNYLPGVCSFETIEKNHKLALDETSRGGYHPLHPDETRRENATAEDMLEAHELIINYKREEPCPVFLLGTITSKGRLVWTKSGNPLKVTQEGFSIIDKHLTYETERHDFVIVSSGRFPQDKTLYNAHRGFAMNEVGFAKNVLWLAECREGAAPEEGRGEDTAQKNFFELLFKFGCEFDRAFEYIEQNYKLYRQKAYKFLKKIESLKENGGNIYFYSALPEDKVRKSHMIPVKEPQKVIDNWLREEPDAEILVVNGANKVCAVEQKYDNQFS